MMFAANKSIMSGEYIYAHRHRIINNITSLGMLYNIINVHQLYVNDFQFIRARHQRGVVPSFPSGLACTQVFIWNKQN